MWNTTLYVSFSKYLKNIFLTCAHFVYGKLAAKSAMHISQKLLVDVTYSYLIQIRHMRCFLTSTYPNWAYEMSKTTHWFYSDRTGVSLMTLATYTNCELIHK